MTMTPSGSKENPEAGTFQRIDTSPKVQTLIIAVPGIGTPSPEDWTDSSAEKGSGRLWLQQIPVSSAPGPALYGYVHGITPSELSWPTLLGQGKIFLDALLGLIEESKLSHCPILIVSHSLGGLIMKEALRRSYEGNYRDFLRSLAGVIFLGTPHSTDQVNSTQWQRAGMAIPAVSRRKRSLSSEDVSQLVNSSMAFERAAVKVPILSIHETKETRVKTRFIVSKKSLIMDAAFVRTGCDNEEILGVDSDHNTLCNLDVTAEYFANICNFVETSLQDARFEIIRGSPTFDLSSAVDDWTVAGEDKGRKAKATEDGSSNPTVKSTLNSLKTLRTLDATAGSSDMGFDFIPQFNAMTYSPVQLEPRFPIFMVSAPRNRDFFGRKDVLSAIDDTFFSITKAADAYGSADARTFAICGPGGMGKTQIAAEFAHSRRDRFDAVFWIHADTSVKLRDEFSRLAIALGLVAGDSTDARDPAITRDLVKGWLANPIKADSPWSFDEISGLAKWLLIFDNLDDMEVLEEFWPVDGPGCILFTSRDSLAKNSSFLASTGVDLQALGVEEASEFLEKLTKKKGDSSEVHARLGGLPLAITQMASIIIRGDLSYEEFVQRYDEEIGRDELFQERYGKREDSSYKETIWSVWALESLKHSKSLLDVVSFLDPDGIWEGTLTGLPESLPLPETYPRTAFAYQKARTELLQSSLINRDSSAKRLRVHRLIQDTARAKMAPGQYREAFFSAVQLISSKWPFEKLGWRHSVSRWKVCEELFPHVVSLHKYGAMMELKREDIEAELLFCGLLTDAGWYYHERGYSSESTKFFISARKICDFLKPVLESSTSPTAPDQRGELDDLLAELHHNLGCIETETNDPKSTLEHFKIFNEMMISKTGSEVNGKDQRLAVSWNELGNAYMMNKMWQEGEACFKNSIESSHLLKNFQPTDTSFPYVNLGLAYWLMGRNDDAIKHLLIGLKHREDAYGVDDNHSFITGRFLYALGNVTESQGKLGESLTYHKRALQQFQKTIGKNHHRTGDVHVRLAGHELRNGHLDEARSHANEALRIFGKNLVFRNEKARTLYRLSKILAASGDAAGSEKAWRESTELYQVLYPNSGKAATELDDSDFDEAVAFWSR